MFDVLTEKFNDAFRALSGKGKISEENVRDAMRTVRTALLEADVNLNVVNTFVSDVTTKAIGQNVINTLQPAQLMVKVVHDELINLLGPVDTQIYTVAPGPTVIMMCGLQGSGKTTTCGKLAAFLKTRGHDPMLAAVDLQRPAAVQQLRTLGAQTDTPVYADDGKVAAHGDVTRGAAVAVAKAAVVAARSQGRDILILDTAGRLAIDAALMDELKDVNEAVKPHQIFLVLDSMTGQDAVNSAKAFNEKLELDGLILTKFDSDTRGGALLSAKMVTGKPVKFLGTGEKLDALEEFRPEGVASRILGMGDIVGLVEEAHGKFDMEQQAALAAKMEKGAFTLEDFIGQMGQIKKLGPMTKILGMIPGMSEMAKQANMGGNDVEKHMGRMQAMYDSMTHRERQKPDTIDAPRRRRIATGAGVDVQAVGQFLKQFEMSRSMMKAVGGMGVMNRMKMMKGLMSGDLGAIAAPGANLLGKKKGGWQAPKDRNKKGKRR